MSTKPEADDAEPVPKLPRGRGLKLSRPELFRIALTLITLIGVIVLTPMCARSVATFVTSFDQDREQPMPEPGNVDVPTGRHYEQLKPGMSEQELKAAIERAKSNAAGAGSAADPMDHAGSGSASPPHGAAEGSSSTRPAPAPKP